MHERILAKLVTWFILLLLGLLRNIVLRLKSFFFWDIWVNSSSKVNRYFKRTCHLYGQGQTVSQARNQHQADSKLVSSLVYSLIMKTDISSCETYTDYHHPMWLILQKTEIFIVTSVRTPYPTNFRLLVILSNVGC